MTDELGNEAAAGVTDFRRARPLYRALQFVADGNRAIDATGAFQGEAVDDQAIEKLLRNLVQAPLGLSRDDDFRISVAGAQEKTALLQRDGRWLKPHGTTPTTHIFKTQVGQLPNGIDLSNSVENEYYCLKLLEAFGLPANAADIMTFGDIKALVIERFARFGTACKRLKTRRPTVLDGRFDYSGGEADGAQGRNRTTDTAIFNRMLYQLSYLGPGTALANDRQRAGVIMGPTRPVQNRASAV